MRTFEAIRDDYLSCWDTVQCLMHDAEVDGDAPGLDDAACRLTDLARELLAGNFVVSCDCDFNGRTLTQSGRLIHIRGNRCYIEAGIGNCKGDSLTMELIDDHRPAPPKVEGR